MIFLNPTPYFREAIGSVRAQTWTDWELLLVDDGSEDGSSEVARHAAQACPGQIRYLAHPGKRNRGMSASRLLGLREAQGAAIAFLDADDVWPPAYLSEQMGALREHPKAAASVARTITWRSWDGNDGGADGERKLGALAGTLAGAGELPRLWLTDQAETPGTCSIVVRREAARRHPFETAFRGMFEDQVFLYKLALHEPVYVNAKAVAYYRQHAAGVCSLTAMMGAYNAYQPNRSEWRFLQWLRRYARQQRVPDAVFQQVLAARIARYGPRPLLVQLKYWAADTVRYAGRLRREISR